jgi:hypothetical protein
MVSIVPKDEFNMADIRKIVESILNKTSLSTEDSNKAIVALVKYREQGVIRGNTPPDVDSGLIWDDTEEGIKFWQNIQRAR